MAKPPRRLKGKWLRLQAEWKHYGVRAAEDADARDPKDGYKGRHYWCGFYRGIAVAMEHCIEALEQTGTSR